MASVQETIVDVINAAVSALTKGTNLFVGPPRPQDASFPDKCVFVWDTGGPPPQRYIDGGAGTNLSQAATEILIRSTQEQYQNGYDLAILVQNAVEKSTPVGALSHGCMIQQAKPNYIGKDDQGCHNWTINTLTYKEE